MGTLIRIPDDVVVVVDEADLMLTYEREEE